MPTDPRSTRRYRDARRQYLATTDPVCCMCGKDIPPEQVTIEHRFPVHCMRATTWAELVDMVCDTSTWAVACKPCQSKQGQQVTTKINRLRNHGDAAPRPRVPRTFPTSRRWLDRG